MKNILSLLIIGFVSFYGVSYVNAEMSFKTYKSKKLDIEFEYPTIQDGKLIIPKEEGNTISIPHLRFSIFDVSTENKMKNFIKNKFGEGCIEYETNKSGNGNYTLNVKSYGTPDDNKYCFINYSYFSNYSKKLGKIILSDGMQSCDLIDETGKCIINKVLNSIKFITPLKSKIDKVLNPLFEKIEKKDINNQVLIYNNLISKVEKINTNKLSENQKFIVEYLLERLNKNAGEGYCLSKGGHIETRKIEQEEFKVCFVNDGLDGINCRLDLFFQKKCGHIEN